MAKAPAKTTFTSILDKPGSEIKDPVLLPVGHYVFTIKGMPRIDKSSKKQTEFVEFNCAFIEPTDDVDAEELTAAGGCAGKEIKNTYYVTENSAFMLKNFLVSIGWDPESSSMREYLDETPGKSFIGQIKHEPSQDGQRMFARIGTTAPVEG